MAQFQTLQITLTLPPGVQGAIYNAQVSAAGGTAPYSASITSGALPPGLNLVRVDASTGAITGTPSAMGTFPFTLSITDAMGMSASQPHSLTVAGPQGGSSLSITSASPPSGQVGSQYQFTIQTAGGVTPILFAITLGALPSGLALNPSSGIVSGTPTSSGNFSFVIRATDSNSSTASSQLTIAVAAFSQTVSPSSYSAYSGVDPKPAPPAPALGPANSIINDPTFGSRILRVTDQNTAGGQSFIPTDAGFHRTWNSNSTAIKLQGPQGQGYWLEFNPNTLSVGDGSSHPVPHQLAINYFWEWSAVDPDTIYFLNGSALVRYNKATSTAVNLASTPTGEPVTSYAVVVGLDNWVCSAAGAGYQDTYTKILCVTPSNPSSSKFIDVAARTINGVTQSDPNWPTSASGQTIGIHSINGGAGASWLGVTFHQQSWGGNGDAVFNLATNTWSLVTNADPYWSGHTSIGNGKFVNGSGSIDGRDGRGAVVRDPNNLMGSAKYLFVAQPQPTFGWFDGEHSSWFNSTSNPNAPVLFSRYTTVAPSPWQTWEGEIIAAATDGSNKVWRFAHTHCPLAYNYYASAFAQISYDGRFALFSSSWDGTLGVSSTGNFIATRIDTFIVELAR